MPSRLWGLGRPPWEPPAAAGVPLWPPPLPPGAGLVRGMSAPVLGFIANSAPSPLCDACDAFVLVAWRRSMSRGGGGLAKRNHLACTAQHACSCTAQHTLQCEAASGCPQVQRPAREACCGALQPSKISTHTNPIPRCKGVRRMRQHCTSSLSAAGTHQRSWTRSVHRAGPGSVCGGTVLRGHHGGYHGMHAYEWTWPHAWMKAPFTRPPDHHFQAGTEDS